ncbi:dihydroorotate dehydrogenase [Bacilli bacterium]|nr:dihydroorotate dehydrogenase [Bacilli bacterium]
MITNYKLEQNTLVASNDGADFTLVIQPTKEEIGHLATTYEFPFDYIAGILDDDENARFEIDGHHNLLLLLQYPCVEADATEVYPFSLIVNPKKKAVILALNHEYDLTPIFERHYDATRYQHELIFQMMSVLGRSFNYELSQYKKRMKVIEKELARSQENAQLMEMIRSQKSLIYFEAALEDNIEVYQKLMTYLRDQGENGFSDRIFDIYVEADQALTTTKIQLKLLENLSDLFSNIVSNNLNIMMKIMTSATFIMTIPAIIAGLYGMNVKLPFQNVPYAFWLIMVAATAISWLVFRVMLKKRMF